MIVDKIIRHAYSIIGRGEKLRNEQIDDAINALDIMFTSWANKGADLWRTSKVEIQINKPVIISHNDKQYICLRDHTSSEFNEPGVGASSQVYWLETEGHEETEAWYNSTQYPAANFVSLMDETIYSVGRARILDGTQIFDVEFVTRSKFDKYDPANVVTDNSGNYKAVFVPGRPGYSPGIILHPTPDREGLVLDFYKIAYADSNVLAEGVPNNWLAAIQYGLAVELGYMNGIGLDVLTSIVNKFKYEFQRARGSEREVVSSCFIDPLY